MIEQAVQVPRHVLDEALSLGYTARTGLIAVQPPSRIIKAAWAYQRYGAIGASVVLAAERFGDRAAVVDERGTLSYRELDRHSDAIASAWVTRGLRSGRAVAIMARNHRGFLEALFAAAKCGARIVLLNTDFSAPALQAVCQREGADLLVLDEEFLPLATELDVPQGIWRAWSQTPGADTLDCLIATADGAAPPRPHKWATLILLTSGTTGMPKGAPRSELRTLTPIGAIFGRVPFRVRGVTECAAPMFHALGVVHAVLAVALGSTLILRRRFDPAATLDSLVRHRVTALIVVPIMLRRILELGPTAVAGHDLSHLRIVFVGGSQLGADLCKRAGDAFGPVLYNLYGSTEVAFASIATPEDLQVAPGCVGRIAPGPSSEFSTTTTTSCPPNPSAGSSSATPRNSRATPAAERKSSFED
jgi:fatty-acyl-CoA synthase